MTARSGMTDILLQLRTMADVGTADWTQGTASMFDDDQLQIVADEYRIDEYRVPLRVQEDYIGGGSIVYKEYLSDRRWWEKTTGGTAIFTVETSNGSAVGTADYSVDYQRGIVTFGADQKGTAYYLTGRRFRLNAAAAEVWRRKAGYAAKHYGFSTDGHSFQRQQFFDHCLKMASHFESRESEIQTFRVRRSDTDR